MLQVEPEKDYQEAAGFSISAPAVQATIANAVALLDLMPTQLLYVKDNSNPSTLGNLSWSRSLIR